MDSLNVITTKKDSKVNKILIFILIMVMIVTLTLLSIYIYNRFESTKTGSSSLSLITQDNLVIYPDLLPTATIGKKYQADIKAIVYNLNTQINGRVAAGLPPGLQLTSCSTEYNNPTFVKIAAKNSLATCTISGTPLQDGKFTVRVSFSTQDGSANFFREIPLVVNP